MMIGGWNYGFCDSIDSLDNMPVNKQGMLLSRAPIYSPTTESRISSKIEAVSN